MSSAFELPKHLFFAILTYILTALTLVLIVLRGSSYTLGLLKHKAVLTSCLIIICASFVSTVFSLAPLQSFFGSLMRLGGLMSFGIYALFALCIIESFGEEQEPTKHIHLISIPLVLVSIYALVQAIGWDPFMWNTELYEGRVFSTLGHPNILGEWLLLLLPICLISAQHRKTISTKILMWAPVLLGLITLILTQNRASIIIAFLTFLVLFKKEMVTKILSHKLFFILGGIAAILGLVMIGHEEGSDPIFRSFLARTHLWTATISWLIHHPYHLAIGIGFDQFTTLFGQAVSPSIYLFESLVTRADHAHNSLLDILYQGGLLLFIPIIGAMIMWSRWVWGYITSTLSLEVLGLFLGLIALFLSHQFSFPTIVHYVYGVFFVIIIALSIHKQRSPVRVPRIGLTSISIIALIVIGLGLTFSVRLLTTDLTIASSTTSFEQKVTAWNNFPYYTHQLFVAFAGNTSTQDGRLISMALDTAIHVQPFESKLYLLKASFADTMTEKIQLMEKSLLLAPYDIESTFDLSQILHSNGYYKKSQEVAANGISYLPPLILKPSNILSLQEQDKKRIYFKETPYLFPLLNIAARNSIILGKSQEAKHVLDTLPKSTESLKSFALYFESIDQKEEAKTYIHEALTLEPSNTEAILIQKRLESPHK